MALFDEVINRLTIKKGPDKNGWYTALCPFHNDQNHPNLRFTDKGFICMACGTHGNLKKLSEKLRTIR